MKNSWKFGWVLSYPRGEGGTRWNDKSCFRYEPWHYRYLGREVAAKVHASGLTIREYLWANHTQLDRNGRPVATAPPTPTPTPTPTSTSTTSAPTSATPSATATGTPARTGTAGPTTVAQAPVSRWLGLDPTALVAGALALVALLAAAVFVVRRRLSRR
jgi:D-alanyl-D-alanine carboxypeptidase